MILIITGLLENVVFYPITVPAVKLQDSSTFMRENFVLIEERKRWCRHCRGGCGVPVSAVRISSQMSCGTAHLMMKTSSILSYATKASHITNFIFLTTWLYLVEPPFVNKEHIIFFDRLPIIYQTSKK